MQGPKARYLFAILIGTGTRTATKSEVMSRIAAPIVGEILTTPPLSTPMHPKKRPQPV